MMASPCRSLTSINGVKINNLAHAKTLLDAADSPIVEMLFGESAVVCLDRKEAVEANKRILKAHKIPAATNL